VVRYDLSTVSATGRARTDYFPATAFAGFTIDLSFFSLFDRRFVERPLLLHRVRVESLSVLDRRT
jgi:hypothetical protein